MIFALPVLIYTLLFLVSIQLAIYRTEDIFYIFLASIIISLWAAKKIGKKWTSVIIPIFFPISSFILLYLIDATIEKHLFSILSALLYYIALLGILRISDYEEDQTARGMIAAAAFTVLFFFFSAVYGIYLNFFVPLWLLMLVFLLATLAVSFQYFSLVENKTKTALSYGVVLGMIMAEIAWVINFWPFGYLTTGVIVLMLYYVFWDLINSYFLNILSKKRAMANLIFFGILIALILSTSRWLPIV